MAVRIVASAVEGPASEIDRCWRSQATTSMRLSSSVCTGGVKRSSRAKLSVMRDGAMLRRHADELAAGIDADPRGDAHLLVAGGVDVHAHGQAPDGAVADEVADHPLVA